ncbi:MAG: NAD(P)-dependent oxidoreductase, partial [Burkholderiaceae bacterium]|nr:NAD(P)-dependent oxidoreductase [Burkholderiaceae bacterium]
YFPPWLFEVPQVSCARGVAAVPIAEFVMAALLAHVRPLADSLVADPVQWRRGFERTSASPPGLLAGQTLGLVGFGAIGQAVARRALAFDMRVLALRRSQAPSDVGGVQAAASLHEVMAESDHVVLALPITPATHHMIDAAALAQARAGLHLINIARGALVDHDALLAALDVGRLSAATLDVTEPEPLPPGHALYTHPRVRLTPHIAWAAGDVVGTSTRKFLGNLARFLDSQALDDVFDPVRGY